MILVALSLWPSYGLAAISIFYEDTLSEEYRMVLLALGGLYPLNICFGIIAALTKRRLGETKPGSCENLDAMLKTTVQRDEVPPMKID